MDIATIIGIAGGFVLLFGVILLEGSSPMQFLNLLATLVVVGGSGVAVLIRYPLHDFLAALMLGVKEAFFHKQIHTPQLIDKITELSHVLRKTGPIGLENIQVEDRFLARGLQMLADGYDMVTIKRSLERERDLQYERLEEGHKIFKALGEAAPGMGMVGTLIGLVSMFSHMDDPKKIGPGMAIALLTTLYGAIMSNLVALPIADKLQNRAQEAATNNSLIIDAILMMRENKSPMQINDELQAYLPLHKREDKEAA
jgi:chemotaxis protein MotA